MNRKPSARIESTTSATNPPRVALIGPVLPFRGGIAQYTTQLRRALAPLCTLRTVSYLRQYPAWLYPGKSDREPGLESFREYGVAYELDAVNPLTWRRVARSIAEDGCDLAVFDWWTLFWAPAIALMARALRRRGVRVAFLCHNLFDHDASSLKRKIATLLLAQADSYLVHSREQAASLQATFPRKTVVTHPLPPFDQLPPPSMSLPKRGRLELLFFGFIRPYKGLDVLVDALTRLDDKQVYLTVVGEPWCSPDDLRQRIEDAHAPNIELHLDYVEDTVAADFFARADLVVLPYRSASGSGVAGMAFHYDCPILATRTGAFPDMIEEGKTGFLVAPDSVDELATAIKPLTRAQLVAMRQHVHEQKSRYTWDSLAQCLIELARQSNTAIRQPRG